MDTLIVSAAPAFISLARAEVEALVGEAPWAALAPGVGAVATPDAADAARAVSASRAVFVRHVVPATVRIPVTGGAADLDAVRAAVVEQLARAAPSAARLGVQVRVLPGAPPTLGRKAVWDHIREVAEGARTLDARHPDDVLSVVVTATDAWLGLAPTGWHRSPWSGGERHFAHKGTDQVSRAGFKLLEAIEVFQLTLAPGQRAVDLGAAPGGWTHVLAQAGLRVDAVDPAALDPRVLALPGVRHHRQRAEVWLEDSRRHPEAAWLVNDMRMDASDAARLLVQLAPGMVDGARLVTTLKLPERGLVTAMRRAVDALGAAWEVDAVRHLFHNRTEVTVAATRR